MNIRKIAGIGLIVVGVLCVGVSYYIKQEVAEGKQKIASAEKQVNTGENLFSLSPVTKEMSKGLTDSAHNKINAGKEQVSRYSTIAKELQVGGFALLVVGCAIFLLKNKKRHF
ncbi:MAG: hypothetical protein LVR00_02750 [Rhabdochlamydiaceae bacterium]|jgi:hypothetical protein